MCLDMFNDMFTVPDVPVLTSVNRFSGSSAMISWIPLTQAEARGFLNIALEIVYEPIIDSALNCSTYDFLDSESILMTENLFEKSTANITGLEPNREYCIAIQISTNGGESGFSNAVKLPCKLNVYSFRFIMVHTITRSAKRSPLSNKIFTSR